MGEIKIELPKMTLPARTKVTVVGSLDFRQGTGKVSPKYHYRCLDCPFETYYLDEMNKHQADPNKHRLKE